MRLLNLLERLGEFPAEIWLVPPVVMLLTMAAIGEWRRRARLRRYRAIAERTGLSVKAKIINASEVHGVFRGRPLVMTIASRQRQTLRRRWTRLVIDVKNPELIGLQLWRQGPIDTLFMTAGFKELQIGDAEFDRRYVIQTRDPDLVRTLLQDASLRQDLMRADVDSVHLLSEKIHVYYAREERSPEHAERLFTAATRLADGIDALKGEYKPEIIR